MKVAIGADHRGFTHKKFVKTSIIDIEWIDVGAYDENRSDYPLFAHMVAKSIVDGKATHGVLICGSGIGMAITANRYKGILAALVWNEEVAAQSKTHDNSNILVLPSDYITQEQAVKMIRAWLNAKFLGGRYRDRIKMIDTK